MERKCCYISGIMRKGEKMRSEKKLLFVGCSIGTGEALKYAREKGIYTIITDYNSPEIAPLKKVSDEYWMIDAADIDKLERKCREEKITGVFAATSEFCLDVVKELCNRLNMPFFASEKGWKCARNKQLFKKYCMDCNVETPRIWYVGNELTQELLDSIDYPVIVKPIDSCAQQGINICENERELCNGFKTALEKSALEKAMVEEYIVGEEIASFYYFFNGEAILSELDDLVYMQINGRNDFVFVKNYSKYMKEYMEKIEPGIQRLFQQMDCRNGTAYLQGIRKDGKIYFIELGYRLDGIGAWKRNEMSDCYSSIELLVDIAAGDIPQDIPEDSSQKLYPDRPAGTYLLWARPGKIARIEGVDIVKQMKDVNIILDRFQIGDEVPQMVSMHQIAFCICMVAEKKQKLKEYVRRINDALHIYDEKGNDLLYYLTDYDALE